MEVNYMQLLRVTLDQETNLRRSAAIQGSATFKSRFSYTLFHQETVCNHGTIEGTPRVELNGCHLWSGLLSFEVIDGVTNAARIDAGESAEQCVRRGEMSNHCLWTSFLW